ncbi:Swi5-dependent recombination DNA repair protein 1-like protein [Trichoplax sp. H2]|nr:Swi5-dependent recombination DNA repair protein 1-like protein [Trichoplax sp. H2]|eukprot:RDD46373.1 Swi5-dependent recombination DNA repair protein 1-like protein [Trichoplax sp. H2]
MESMDTEDLKAKLLQIFQDNSILTCDSIVQALKDKKSHWNSSLLQVSLQQLVDSKQVYVKVIHQGSQEDQKIYYRKPTPNQANWQSSSSEKKNNPDASAVNSSKKRRSIGLAPANRKKFSSPLLKKSSGTVSNHASKSSTDTTEYHHTTPATSSTEVDTFKMDKENVPESEKCQVQDLLQSKAKLLQIIQEKEDKLRKLKLVKMYHTKTNLDDLDQLILKWRSISQDVAQQLHEKIQIEPRPTMAQFLDAYHIDRNLIQYSADDEAFV